MQPEHQALLMVHGVGFLGVVVNCALGLASLSTVNEARRVGCLGGLDTRPWPLFFWTNLLWTLYGAALGDFWICAACGPAAIIWLFFCLTAISLMSQEEGELRLPPPPPRDGVFLRRTTVDLKHLSQVYRKKHIKKTENGVAVALGFALCMSFFCSKWNVQGLEFLTDAFTAEAKLLVYGSVCAFSSVVCYCKPILRFWILLKRRDASSIFMPVVVAQLFNNGLWASYGLLTSNFANWLPNFLGGCVALGSLCLKFAFSGTAVKNEDEQDEDDEPECKYASGSTDALDMESTELADSEAQSDLRSVADDASVSSGIRSNVPLPMSARPKRTQSRLGELPDLTDRLKEQGIYEDYLKWQEGYRKWRQGGASGAHGEITEKTSKLPLPSIPDDNLIPGEVPEELC